MSTTSQDTHGCTVISSITSFLCSHLGCQHACPLDIPGSIVQASSFQVLKCPQTRLSMWLYSETLGGRKGVEKRKSQGTENFRKSLLCVSLVCLTIPPFFYLIWSQYFVCLLIMPFYTSSSLGPLLQLMKCLFLKTQFGHLILLSHCPSLIQISLLCAFIACYTFIPYHSYIIIIDLLI